MNADYRQQQELEEQAMAGVYKIINEVHAELAKIGISKSDTNTYDKYNFRGIDAVYNTVSPILAKHGLLILQRVLTCNTTERVSKNGGVLFSTVVEVEFDLVSAHDGSHHTIKTFGEGMDRSDKSVNKALTAAYKYALFQCFCIPTEAQDADSDTHEVVEVDPLVVEAAANQIIETIASADYTEEQKKSDVKEIWKELSEEEKKAAWVAKTKGGYFSQQEKEFIRSSAQ